MLNRMSCASFERVHHRNQEPRELCLKLVARFNRKFFHSVLPNSLVIDLWSIFPVPIVLELSSLLALRKHPRGCHGHWMKCPCVPLLLPSTQVMAAATRALLGQMEPTRKMSR